MSTKPGELHFSIVARIENGTAVLSSLLGGLLGPAVVLIGALVPYLLQVGLPVLIREFWLHFAIPCRTEKRP